MVHFKTVNSELGIRSLLEGLHDLEDTKEIKKLVSSTSWTSVCVLAKTIDESLPASEGSRRVTFRFCANTGNVTVVTGHDIEDKMLEIMVKVDALYATSTKTVDDGKTKKTTLPIGCQKVLDAFRFPPWSKVQSKDLASDSEEWEFGISNVAETAWSSLRSYPKQRQRLVDCLVKEFGCPLETIENLVALDSKDDHEWIS